MSVPSLGWLGIVRLGLVQTALGAIVVLTTATLNRVMVVELALAAVVPGLLVGLHYGVQLLRPLWGHASDLGGRRTPWIVGGMATLAIGGTGAAVAVSIMEHSFVFGLILAVLDFALIGFGVGAAGTSLLALLASSVRPERRPAAATIVWLMMIAGMAVTAVIAGANLDPFSFGRLVGVVALASICAFALTCLAVWRVETTVSSPRRTEDTVPFRQSLADAWGDPQARLFTIFVFVSMIAFSAQDLILEPFGGFVFGLSPGETTKIAGLQHGGVFAGMVLTGLLGTLWSRRNPGALRMLTVAGCAASGAAVVGLTVAAASGGHWPLHLNVFALGFTNGCFAVAAIGSMMALAGVAGPGRTGMRMGLWGAAQAIAFGMGGLMGATVADVARLVTGEPAFAFGLVFAIEAVMFVVAAVIASRLAATAPIRPLEAGEAALMAAE